MDHKKYADRERSTRRWSKYSVTHGVEVVVLAGFMRIVTEVLLDAFPMRVLNVHPALLPAFPGVHAQKQALDYGVRVTGCTVHFVDAGTDTGPIVAQETVPVLDGDDEETPAQRILEREQSFCRASFSSSRRAACRVERSRVPGRAWRIL